MEEKPAGGKEHDTIVPKPAAQPPWAPATPAPSAPPAASTPPAAPGHAATGEELSKRWDAIAAIFVDDPHRAVEEADRLLNEVVQRIVDERALLQKRWAGASAASTEDLRLALQHYRDLLQALSRRPSA
jgi:hypothetical protein